jgi:hypothetical protein
MRFWTPEEDAVLYNHYHVEGAKYCAEIIGRTVESIKYRAGALGVKKVKPVLDDNFDHGLRAGQFIAVEQKGSVGAGMKDKYTGRVVKVYGSFALVDTGKYNNTVHLRDIFCGKVKVKIIHEEAS